MDQLSLDQALTKGDPIKSLTGEEMMQRAMTWIFNNFYAWQRMKETACERATKGIHFSIADLAEEARYRMRVEGKDQGFKVNNSIRAALARQLIRECPVVEPFIEIRSSKVDWV